MTWRDALLALRERGWTQRRIADALGTQAQQVNLWQNGKCMPIRFYQELLIKVAEKEA